MTLLSDSQKTAGTTLNPQSGFVISYWNGAAFESRWFTIAQLISLLIHWDQDSTNLSTTDQRHLLPLNDNTQNLGSDTKMWKQLFLKGRIQTDSTIQISTVRTIPNPNVNSNWANDGSTYLGNWTLALTPGVTDLVSWAGDLYANNSGSNSAVNPALDGGANWDLYASPFIGAWSSATTYAMNDIVSFGGTVYYHVTTLQETYNQIYFDGTAFYFGTQAKNWMKIDASKLSVDRIEPLGPSGGIAIVATGTAGINASDIGLTAGHSAGLTASQYLFIQVGSSGQTIWMYDTSLGDATTVNADQRAILISSKRGKIAQFCYNSVVIGGDNNICNEKNTVALGGSGSSADHFGEVVFGNNTTLAQSGKLSFYGEVYSDSPTELTLNGLAGKYFTIAAGTGYAVTMSGIAIDIDTSVGDSASFTGTGIIKNVGGTTSAINLSMPQLAADASMTTISISITADDTNDRMAIVVTGNPGVGIRWNITVEYVKIKFV